MFWFGLSSHWNILQVEGKNQKRINKSFFYLFVSLFKKQILITPTWGVDDS